MVYIINAQDCYASWLGIGKVRNQISHGNHLESLAKILGHGPNMAHLKSEIDAVGKNDFKLSFNYPGAELRTKLRIVNRDLTLAEQRDIKRASRAITDLASDLVSGKVRREDLPEEQVEALKKMLGSL